MHVSLFRGLSHSLMVLQPSIIERQINNLTKKKNLIDGDKCDMRRNKSISGFKKAVQQNFSLNIRRHEQRNFWTEISVSNMWISGGKIHSRLLDWWGLFQIATCLFTNLNHSPYHTAPQSDSLKNWDSPDMNALYTPFIFTLTFVDHWIVVVDSSTPLSLIEETRTTHPFMLEDGPIEGCDGRDFELKCKDNNPVIDMICQNNSKFCSYIQTLVFWRFSERILLMMVVLILTN